MGGQSCPKTKDLLLRSDLQSNDDIRNKPKSTLKFYMRHFLPLSVPFEEISNALQLA